MSFADNQLENNISIKFYNVSKKYDIGEHNENTIKQVFANVFKKNKPKKISVLALDNLSFDVNTGEVLGVIGKNGAGKSTILKLLSKITNPTNGSIYVKGKVISLLELGTGFHPDLTGRENVYLNGAILGMKRKDIQKNIESIIDFSEIRHYIDTPVKKYSSGMYLRLAFSIAVHLEADILVLDEILATGDSEFQSKCKKKIQEFIKLGKTVVVASHDLPLIRYICHRVILLDKGQKMSEGKPSEMIDKYFEIQSFDKNDVSNSQKKTIDIPHFIEAYVSDDKLQSISNIPDETCANINFEVFNPDINNLLLWIAIFNDEDLRLMAWVSADKNIEIPFGRSLISIKIPIEILKTGNYRISAALYDNQQLYEQYDNIASFYRIVNKPYIFKQKNNNLYTLLEIEPIWMVRKIYEKNYKKNI